MLTSPHAPRAWLSVLACLQLADFGMTWLLVGCGWRPHVAEANPLAAFILMRYGWAGVALLKAATTLVVVLATLAVVRRRPRLGRRLVQFACAVTAAVVGYSAGLALPAEDPHSPSLAHATREASDLDLACRAVRQFNRDKDDLSVRLLLGRADLPATIDALSRLLADLERRVPARQRVGLPPADRRELVATYLFYQVLAVAPRRTPPRRIGMLRDEIGRAFPGVRCDPGEKPDPGRELPWVALTAPV